MPGHTPGHAAGRPGHARPGDGRSPRGATGSVDAFAPTVDLSRTVKLLKRTNFVILGEVLRRVGGKPLPELIQQMLLDRFGLKQTTMTSTANTPIPALHAYDPERGPFEDSTFWNPSWATNTGNMTSDLGDLGKWANALGTGAALTAKSHASQIAPTTAGLGPLTPKGYYGMAFIVANSWTLVNPALIGYTGIVSYLPSKKLAIVVFTTNTAATPPGTHYAAAIFDRVATLLAPGTPPGLPTKGR